MADDAAQPLEPAIKRRWGVGSIPEKDNGAPDMDHAPAGPASTREVITNLLLELTYRWSQYPYIKPVEAQEEERRQMREAFEVLKHLMNTESS